jgi:hypothetical protein
MLGVGERHIPQCLRMKDVEYGGKIRLNHRVTKLNPATSTTKGREVVRRTSECDV